MVEMLAPVAPGQKVAAPSKEKPRTERGKSSPSNRNASQRRDPRLSSGPPAGTVRTGLSNVVGCRSETRRCSRTPPGVVIAWASWCWSSDLPAAGRPDWRAESGP